MVKQKITKTHLILAYLANTGGASRWDTMQYVAAFEGKRFIETSNSSYWYGPKNIQEKGFVYVSCKKGVTPYYLITKVGLQKLKDDGMMWLVELPVTETAATIAAANRAALLSGYGFDGRRGPWSKSLARKLQKGLDARRAARAAKKAASSK